MTKPWEKLSCKEQKKELKKLKKTINDLEENQKNLENERKEKGHTFGNVTVRFDGKTVTLLRNKMKNERN